MTFLHNLLQKKASIGKDSSADSKYPPANSGLKYIEHFDNPYVKICLLCKICNKEQSLKFPATWKRHYLTHGTDDDKPHCCSVCGKRFVQAGNLNKHMVTHDS